MNQFQLFLICLAGWINRNQQNVIEYLQEEVRVLKELLGKRPGFNGCRCLLHDRASVFSEDFRMILKAAGVESVRLPVRSPNLNAFAERFVRSIKESCLDRMVLIGESSSVSDFPGLWVIL